MDLARQRCFNHARREAVARCPECNRYFCRECITEHDDRVICAHCLGASGGDAAEHGWGRLRERTWFVARAAIGLLVAWLVFYHVGSYLAGLPDAFHEHEKDGSIFWWPGRGG